MLRQHTGTTVVGALQQVPLQQITEPQIATAPATTAVAAISIDVIPICTQATPPGITHVHEMYRYYCSFGS